MNDFTPVDLRTPHRQSLWAVVFLAFGTLRSIGVVQILLFVGIVGARLPSALAFASLVVVIGSALFAVAALRWWRFTFELDNGELVIRRGVLQQQRLSIPLGRVQSVSLEQKLLHRFVSLVQVSLDTAGTETTEFVIDAVDRNIARTLQQAVANQRTSSAVAESGEQDAETKPAPPEQVVLRHAPRRIVRIALSQPPFAGLVLLAPLFALAGQLDRVVPFGLPDPAELTGPGWLLWFVPLALTVGLAFSIMLNLARVVLTEWNLTLRSTAAGLRRDAGLLSTTSVAAPIPRVQIVRTRQGLLERWWSLHRVDLATIGNTNIALPGCSSEQMHMVRRLVLSGSDGVEVFDQSVSKAEILLKTRTAAVLAALVSALLGFVIGWWSLLALLSVPYVGARTMRLVRLRLWAITSDAIGIQRAFVGWQRDEALLRKMNGVSVGQRLFERRRGLATVTFSTAAGAVSIGMIPLEQAELIRDVALHSVETDRRAWM